MIRWFGGPVPLRDRAKIPVWLQPYGYVVNMPNPTRLQQLPLYLLPHSMQYSTPE